MACDKRRASLPEMFVFNHVPLEAVPYNGRDYFIVDLKKFLAAEEKKQATETKR